MLPILRFLLRMSPRERLAGASFFPMPLWLKRFLRRYPAPKRVSVYAQLCRGVDLSVLAPNEYGCAEAVSRLLNTLGFHIPIITGTWTLNDYMEKSAQFERIDSVEEGCIIIAITGTGNGKIRNGHTGVYVRGAVMNNNSYTGEWDDHYTWEDFLYRYGRIGGFQINIYRVKD